MAKARRRSFQEQYLQVPNRTAQAPELKNNEKSISLEALGLIVNLCSYGDNWELNKTELYKRFALHKETSVRRIWKELIEAGYMVEYKYRVGKKWEYVYFYDIVPYTPEQIKIILQEGIEEFGEIRKLENPDIKGSVEVLIFKSSNCSPQYMGVNKYKRTKDKLTKNKQNQKDLEEEEEKNNNYNKEPEIILPSELEKNEPQTDEEPFEINNFAFEEFKKEFNLFMPNYFNNESYSRIYQEMIKQKVSFITVAEAVKQMRMMENRKDTLPPIGDWFNYFIGGIQMNRTSEVNAIMAEKYRKGVDQMNTQKHQEKANDKQEPLPFYNWLDAD